MTILALSRTPRHGAARNVEPAVTIAHSPGELMRRLKTERPDLVVLEHGRQAVLNTVLHQAPSVPVLIVRDIKLLQESGLNVIRRMRRRSKKAASAPAAPPAHTMPAFHSSSGRVDATRVADFFGLSLSELARRLFHRSPQSVHKTPDAPRLQEPLSVLVRIATSLTHLYGTPENARIWLNAPHPSLDKARPIHLMKIGKAEIVAELLEDALLAHPG